MFFIGKMVPQLKTKQSKSEAGEGSGSSLSACSGATSKKKMGNNYTLCNLFVRNSIIKKLCYNKLKIQKIYYIDLCTLGTPWLPP